MLEVSSNVTGTHDVPSVYLYLEDGSGSSVGFGTFDPAQVKEIIEHMAKMAGLEVEVPFSKPFKPQYQPGDRVRPLNTKGHLGTVKADTEHFFGWNVAVVLDGDDRHGLYLYEELEPVTKSV